MFSTFKIRPMRQGVSVRFMFARPILNWQSVGSNFVTALYDNLSSKIPILPNEIQFHQGVSLSDVWVKYSIYGGSSTISLWSDRLALDFPVLTSADYAVALDILRTSHDMLPKVFPEQGCDRVESNTAEHLEFISPGDVERFLDRFRLASVDKVFKDAPVTQLPSVKFGIVDEREKWQYMIMAERSQLNATGLFILRQLTLKPVDPKSTFEQKYEIARNATLRCYAVLGLELEADAPAT